MDTLERLELCKRKSSGCESCVELAEYDINAFREKLNTRQEYKSAIEETEDWKEYFRAFDLIRESTPKELREDLFYAIKLGFFYRKIPTRLVYVLKKAYNETKAPNTALSAINALILKPYLKEGVLPEGVSIKEILENVIGEEIDLLGKYVSVAKFKACAEVYVKEIDKIVILPDSIVNEFKSRKDVESIVYDESLGLMLQGTPIRTLGGCCGVTTNEFDLRGCK